MRRIQLFSGYIPTSNLFSSEDLSYFNDPSHAVMKIQAFNLIGAPHSIKGVQEFRLQHVPEFLHDSEISANYAEHTGLGLTRKSLHYLHTTGAPVEISFIMSDAFEGPPHATRDYLGNIIYNDFQNLWEVASWFKALTSPVVDWKKPPYVRASFGRWSQFGVIYAVNSEWIHCYGNGDPHIARVSFTLQPDGIVVTDQQSFFSVK